MDEQERVARFLDEHDLDGDPAYRILDLAAEVGEVAADAAKSADYGESPGDLAVSEDELGDALFSLLATRRDGRGRIRDRWGVIRMGVPRYVVNVDVAVARAGEYLFIERAAGESHAAGALAFPGGKVEDPPGKDDSSGVEDPIAATARREVREEVGVTVEDVGYVLSNTFESDDGHSVLNVVVRGEYAGGDAHVRAEDEVAAVHWLSPDTLDGRDDVPPYLETYVERVRAK